MAYTYMISRYKLERRNAEVLVSLVSPLPPATFNPPRPSYLTKTLSCVQNLRLIEDGEAYVDSVERIHN